MPFYVVFDSPSETLHERYDNQLRVFGLANGRYQSIDVSGPEPRVWFDELELGLGVWQGAYQGIQGKWLRWYEASGNWIPTEVEARTLAEAQAETERSARTLAEAQAETERSARTLAETQAEAERSARTLAETQAETERSARRSAIPRLASLGLTAEQIAESLGLPIAEVQAEISV